MKIVTEEELVAAIESFLERHGMAETTFGSLAKGEAQFLGKLRAGRSPSLRVARQVVDFMADRDCSAGHGQSDTAPPAAPSPGNDTTDSPEVQHA